jgi:hypothetical protein
MHRHRRLSFLGAALVLSAGCQEHTTTGPELGAASVSSDLALVVPTGLRDRLVARTLSTVTDGAGPARTEHLGYGTYSWDEPIVAYSSIWDAKTIANFLSGQLSVIGSHYYTGNKGSVATSGRVYYDGVEIGVQRSRAENTFPFLLDFAREHFIWTEARIYTDRTCDLTGFGDSEHGAWWEAVMGGPVFQFHNTTRSSVSDREYQPDCASAPPPPPPPPSTGTSTGGGSDAICYIWIEYDLYTGQIYDQQLLFCTDGG